MAKQVKVNISDAIRRTKRTVKTFVDEFNQDMAEAIVVNTPFITGTLRASWFPSINDPFVGIQNVTPDKDGSKTIARLSAEVKSAEIGDTIYYLNGANYAKHVEFGTKNQRAQSFVRSTVNDAPQIAELTILRIAKT